MSLMFVNPIKTKEQYIKLLEFYVSKRGVNSNTLSFTVTGRGYLHYGFDPATGETKLNHAFTLSMPWEDNDLIHGLAKELGARVFEQFVHTLPPVNDVNDTISERKKLTAYSIEMLKIRSKLYPDSHRVADSIIGQIELLADAIIDAAEQGAEAQFNAFKLGPEITVLSYIDDGHPTTVTINHSARLVGFVCGGGYIDSPYQLEVDALMEVHQSVSNLYNRLR